MREACRVAPLITELITIESVDAGKIENKDCVVGDRSGAGVVREFRCLPPGYCDAYEPSELFCDSSPSQG